MGHLKSDLYRDLEPLRSDDKRLDKIVKQLEKDTDIETSYKDFVLGLLTKEESCSPSKRKREKYDCNHEVNDPHYELFLQNLEIHKMSYVLKHKKNNSCISIRYEGYSDLYEKDGNELGLEKGSIINSETHPDFRKELMCILRKPFDREEYNKLQNAVKIRKAAVRHRELRKGRDKECSTNKPGKSYLDLYPDFRKKLLKFHDDQPRCLNLLRGFFFWLQCLTREGAFKPWNDPKFLAVDQMRPQLKIKQATK
ncbi:unnamed protein product [Fraxinus pennsylvanica]|uniref:Uncharacterized protein n=1 Tax=Fraxinus pennsylvanica TaxID=56036 RepID=A0AAD2DUT5_9LAMI|nr:unnamed protein product [Fraxinus pennsylvanica]